MISKTILALVILSSQGILANDRFLQINTTSGDASYSNPYANPVLPLCFLGNSPVCGANNATYANECVLTLLGQAKQYDGWCTQANVPTNVDTTTLVTPQNGYLVNNAAAIDQNCPKCSNALNPVCGINGVTYQNYCKLKECAQVDRASNGPCGALNFVAAENPQDCPCAFSFEPVCGVDGTTYANACLAMCSGVAKKSDNACIRPCGCTNIYKPVCSSDSKSYDNECLMRCDNGKKMYDGKCPTSNPEQCTQCAGFTSPVCGKNGITYDNSCYLNCAKVEQYAEGACPNKNACNCQDNFLPVCGIDHKTYRNECNMGCKNIKLAYYGACKEIKVDNSAINGKCNCGSEIKYVCGQDQRTYLNTCYLNCLGSNKGLHWGKCQQLNPNYCMCPAENKPVCANDGKCYQNECAMKCAGATKKHDGECPFVGGSN